MFPPLSDSMPPLVDDNPPFYPPPHGAADGGQPGLFSAFPGMRTPSSQWPPGTPYPSAQWPPVSTPTSAPAWGYYPPASAPVYAPAAWGQYTPAGPTGYPQGGAGPWHPPTPYFTGQPPPTTPYEPTVMTANPTGWYDQQPHSASPGGGYYVVKKKKRRNSGYGRDEQDEHFLTTMKRTVSQNSPTRRPSLHRSASWGHAGAYGPDYGGAVAGYAKGDVWDEHNLARRPRDWRADFTGRDGLAGYIPQILPSVLKPKTDVRDWTDPERREVHPLLLYKPTQPPIEFDLRTGDPDNIFFATLDRPHNVIDLAQLAFQPSAQYMRLMHPRLPWYVEVYPRHSNGITVGDIFQALATQLLLPIHGRHFWNEALTAADRAMITTAFQERCRDRPDLVPQGVMQADFLGDRCIFQGLVRSAKGLWEIKTTRP